MQMFQPLEEKLLNLERGVVMYDGFIATDMLVAPVPLVKSDNPGLLKCLATKDQVQIQQDILDKHDSTYTGIATAFVGYVMFSNTT